MGGPRAHSQDAGCLQGACPGHSCFLSRTSNEAVGKNPLPPRRACPSPGHQIRLGSQLDIPALGCSEMDHSPTLLREAPSAPCSHPLLPLRVLLSRQCPLSQGTGPLTLVKPLANPAPAHWLYLFINRPISHLAPAQSSTPKRQMQPRDSLSSQGQSRTRRACGPEG